MAFDLGHVKIYSKAVNPTVNKYGRHQAAWLPKSPQAGCHDKHPQDGGRSLENFSVAKPVTTVLFFIRASEVGYGHFDGPEPTTSSPVGQSLTSA